MLKDNIIETTVNLAGRTYPVIAESEEIELIENINSKLSSEITELRSKYPNKLNNQDYLAMLLFTYAKKLAETENSNVSSTASEKLTNIERLLDSALSQ